MHLHEYPEAIALCRKRLISLELSVESLAELVKAYEGEIKLKVAFDQSLKNEAQRKAKELELRANPRGDYAQMNQELKQHREEKEMQECQLELLRNQFSLLKLELKKQIAELEILQPA
ncbi:MAG: hypothetical protein F6K24_31095 [Okeania sp. SIO2D1]|nr:hypothetical protein [Okeania sp. SIO2D1]